MSRACDIAVVRTQARTTATGLLLRDGVAFDDWSRMGDEIARLSSASAWWLGDWMLFGQRSYRDRYRVAVERTGLDYQTLRNYAWVAGSVAMSRRRDTLSFQHHAEVAALSEPEQELWLARAEGLRWTRSELRRALRAWRERHARPDGQRGGPLSLHIPERREERWREAAAIAEQPLADWIVSVADDAADAALRATGALHAAG